VKSLNTSNVQKLTPIKKTAMIVLIFIGALVLVKANLFVYNWVCIIQEHRRHHEKRYIGEIERAATIYGMKHNGKLPDSMEDLTKETDDKPALLHYRTDLWGTPYQFKRNGRKVTITSAGPDRKFNTKDDVTNMGEP
jgi:hypothetical protein